MKDKKFFIGFVSGFLLTEFTYVSGWAQQKLSEIGWMLIPLTLGGFGFYFGMKWLSDYICKEE